MVQPAKQPEKKTIKGRGGRHGLKYLRQFDRTYRNKEKAWKKHLKKYPKDERAKEQITKARDSIKKRG
jgi:hypothetical protein